MPQANPKKPIPQWILSGLLTVAFVGSGIPKLLGIGKFVENFTTHFGYPIWFLYVTGVIEVSLGIALWVRPVRRLAPLGMIGVMLGAAATHIRIGEVGQSVPALVLLALAAVLAVLQRKG